MREWGNEGEDGERQREGERERNRETEFLHALIHFPNV